MNPELPVYCCRHIDRSLTINGDTKKAAWKAIPPAFLKDVCTGQSPEQSTEFRSCWSSDYLYLMFKCADKDIWHTYTHRDEPLYDEEVVEAFLSPSGDPRYYYELEFNPVNTIFDASVESPDLNRETMVVTKEWTCFGLKSAVRLDGTLHALPPAKRPRSAPSVGWSVEVAIPFAAFPEIETQRPSNVWRVNFYRIDRGDKDEYTAWSPIYEPSPNFHIPARFGYFIFES